MDGKSYFDGEGLRITDAEFEKVKISNLSHRPNSVTAYGGKALSAKELKEKYDAPTKMLTDKFNGLIDEIIKIEGPYSAEQARRANEESRKAAEEARCIAESARDTSYVKAETNRNADYQKAEEGRDAAYRAAEAARNAAYKNLDAALDAIIAIQERLISAGGEYEHSKKTDTDS